MEIVHYPHTVLTTPCVPVEITPEVVDFVDELIAFMKDDTLWGNCAGLAANQVGKNWRLFVLNGELKDGSDSQVFINPEIVWVTKAPKDTFQEGCYSLQEGQFYRTERAPSIALKWQDLDGGWHEKRYNGLMAQVIQHEMEHLEGKLCAPEDYLAKVREVYEKLTENASKPTEDREPIQLSCEICGDTGEVQEDEYENGQLVGVGTITKKCVCKLTERDHEDQE